MLINEYEYSPKELTQLSNKEIKDLFLKIRSKILTIKINCNIKKELEIYYCYISRELESRGWIKLLKKCKLFIFVI